MPLNSALERASIVWFDQVGRDATPLVGGKGANLGELTQAQIPVPPGFVVTTSAYRAFLLDTGLDRRIAELVEGLNIEDDEALQDIACQVRAAIEEAPMPADLRGEIEAAYRELGEGPVAVRSSATAEDLAEASFAGQQSTYLNIEGAAEVVDAVQRCWASLFEARAIFYRENAGWGHTEVDLAVPVQRMVQSQASGVMFTIDPISNDPERVVIEAAFGLGEAVVSGLVSPDHYEVGKSEESILQRQTFVQDRMLVRNPNGTGSGAGGGETNIWRELSEADGGREKLSDAQVLELTRIGKRIERHYGSPQDIEWGWAEGRFYLLQTRPITTLAQPTGDLDDAPTPSAEPLLSGSAASPGVAAGRVRVVADPAQTNLIAEGDVLVAEMTTPDFVPAMKRAAAIITEKGGRTCHAAIISRELGVPCIVGAAGARELADGLLITVDAASGQVYEGEHPELIDWWRRQQQRSLAEAPETRTKIYVNLADPEIAERVAERAVDGVGLLRAEFIIARIGEHPRSFLDSGRGDEYVARLAEGLATIAGAFHPRPVVYRATDFKTNEYANLKGGSEYEPDEENPMIGYRGAARYVREPDLFELELRALQQVRERYPGLHLMIPFVRTTDELRQVIELVEGFGLRRADGFKIWIMVEVPANVWLLDEFIAQGVDGVSIGSNDLTQLTLGIDRDSERFADTFDERNPAVLKAIRSVIETAARCGVTVSVCGQGPSEHPDLAERLVEWGITSISVTPDVIERTRQLVADAEARVLG